MLARDLVRAVRACWGKPLPEPVAAVARLHLLDAIGVGLAAAGSAVGESYLRFARHKAEWLAERPAPHRAPRARGRKQDDPDADISAGEHARDEKAARRTTKFSSTSTSISVPKKQRSASAGVQTIGSPRTLKLVLINTGQPVRCLNRRSCSSWEMCIQNLTSTSPSSASERS